MRNSKNKAMDDTARLAFLLSMIREDSSGGFKITLDWDNYQDGFRVLNGDSCLIGSSYAVEGDTLEGLRAAIDDARFMVNETARVSGDATAPAIAGDQVEQAAKDDYLPVWAVGRTQGGYMTPGAQLCTRDGTKCGNGFVSYVGPVPEVGLVAEVFTDSGRSLILTEQEMKERFHVPRFLVDVAESMELVRLILSRRRPRDQEVIFYNDGEEIGND